MMKRQRISAVALAGIIVLSMMGCGKSEAKGYDKYVTLGDYKGIKYTKTVEEVTDDEIQGWLDSLTAGLTEGTNVTNRAVRDGDLVNIDYVGTKDGKELEFDFGSAVGYYVVIDSDSSSGVELIGHNIDEEISIDFTFPEEFHNEEIAGASVNFKVIINFIQIETTPELTDALVRENTEYDTIDAYKDSIREKLEKTNEAEAEQQVRNDIFNKVVENSTISGYDEAEVDKLVNEEFERFQRMAKEIESDGYSYEDLLFTYGYYSEEELKIEITEYVKKYLEEKMVLYCIADKEGIGVTSEETEKKAGDYMEEYKIRTKKELYDYFGEEYFEVSILSEKVMAFLKENAVLIDSPEASFEDNSEKVFDFPHFSIME